MDRQGNRKAGKGLLAAGKMGGILCALCLVGCGEAAVSPQPEDETLYEVEGESAAEQSQADLPSEEEPQNTPQPETADREIDCKENDPYEVFTLYEGDSTDEIYLGNLPPEELPDAFPHESMYVCEYDGERLMRIWMYGTGSAVERFFIYDGDSDMPLYCLNLVSGVTHGAMLFTFVY